MQNDVLKKNHEVTLTNISPSIGGIKTILTNFTPATRDQYYRTLLETSIGNSKKIWSNINCILGKKQCAIKTTIKLDGILVAEPETIANALNYYFNSIPITNNNLTAFESYLADQIPEADNFHQTSIHEITKIIKNLKVSNSVGLDNTPTNILKTNVMTLAPILSNLIKKSLAQGLFPQSLKELKFCLYLKVKIY